MKFAWNQPGGLPECPYFLFSGISFKWFSIRSHLWHSDDDARAYHDHPHWFLTIVLRGGYTDVSPNGRDVLRFLSVRFRRADYKHSVQEVIPETRTLLLCGPSKRRWGFWIGDKLIKRDKYFVTHGHHPCDPLQSPVRMRPDGSRR